MRTVTTMALLVLLLHVPVAGAQAESAEETVSRALACFADSWNRHDMAAFGLCFGSDADFVNVTAQWWKGRTAIERNHAFLHGTIVVSDTADVTVSPRTHGMFKSTTLSFTQMTMRATRPDLAIARASSQVILAA